MLQRFFILSFALLIIPAMCFAAITGTIEGTVKDADGKPLGGATVKLEGTKIGTISRPNGSFRLVQVEANTYTLKVTYIGYAEFTLEKVVVNPDRTTTVEVQMSLNDENTPTTKTVYVTASKLVNNDAVGSITTLDGKRNRDIPVESIAGAITLEAGVRNGGNGFQIRGQRTEHTQVRVNGFNTNDEFSGAGGNVGTGYQPIVSAWGTEQTEVISGGASAQYGGAIGGFVNTVVKRGRNDRYSGHVRYRTDAAFANGTSDFAIPISGEQVSHKAEGENQHTFEFGLGGPIPAFDAVTFYLSGRYFTEEFRGNGFDVLDPDGNNLGQMPDQSSWVRNITGRFDIGLTDRISLELGGSYGVTSLEGSGWAWLYANDVAQFADGSTNDVPERVAKQAATNLIINQAYARMKHRLNDNSFYDLSFSWNFRRSETTKRRSFDDPTLFGSIELWEPTDEVTIFTDGEDQLAIENTPDRILDQYAVAQERTLTEDNRLPNVRPVRNPITGYIEGGENNTGTGNAYGLQQLTAGANSFFVTHGNQRALDFRTSTYFQVDGNYTSFFEVNDFKHELKTGFEFKVYSLERHNNSLPWTNNAFYDIYTDEWGGNLYAETPELHEITSQPYEPFEGAFYVQDQIKYKGIIFTPGIRVDFLDPNAQARTRLDTFITILDRVENPQFFDDAPMQVRVSPRLSVAYPVTDQSNLSLSYTVQYQRPTFNNLFDAFNTDRLRGAQIIGTPDLELQTVKAYQIAYAVQMTDNMALNVTAYYRDMFNLTGITYVPASPTPFSVYSVAEYGNSRGLELSFRKIPLNDNFGFTTSYTLSQARGTSSATGTNYSLVSIGGNDGFTDELRTFPLTEYFLSFDVRHRLSGTFDIIFNDGEGPTIGGLKPLEHTHINFTGSFGTGTPYTALDRSGTQVGEFNGERQPSAWSVNSRIQRAVPLADLFGDGMGDTRLTFFVDIFNIFNRTEATSFYARTGNPDNDGNVLDRQIGDFSSVIFYRDADADSRATRVDQYDSFGNRLYNVASDSNLDGVVTQAEKFESYEQFVADFQAQRGRYQFPRQVRFGVVLEF